MKTFKQFLKEDSDNVDNIDGLAKLIVEGGFEQNIRSMLENNSFLFRGSSRKIGYGQIVKIKTTTRESIYSGHQINSNLWNTFDMPSRKHAKFASANRQNAELFGDVYIVVPKDGTKIYGMEKDFNYSFKRELDYHFDYDDAFGAFASDFYYVIERASKYNRDKKLGKKCINLLEKYNRPSDEKVDDKFFNTIDLVFKSLTTDLMNDIHDPICTRLFRDIKNGKTSKDIFKGFFDDCRKLIEEDTSPSNVLSKIKNHNDSEFWWESDTLLMSRSVAAGYISESLLKAIDAIKNNSDK